MSWYRWNSHCACRRGCQGYKRQGETLQWSCPGSTGYLADLATWRDVPRITLDSDPCRYFAQPVIEHYVPDYVFFDIDDFRTRTYADQHARWYTFSFFRSDDAGFGGTTHFEIFQPLRDLDSCEAPGEFPTAGKWAGAGVLLTESSLGADVLLRWRQT